MKTLSVLVVVCLMICEGRIVEFRLPSRDREITEESFEEDYSDLSLEEFREYSGSQRERTLRESGYEPTYGYKKNYKRKYDDEPKYKKPKYSSDRTRGKYTNFRRTPQKTTNDFEKGPTRKSITYNPAIGDRKKEHRSTSHYEQPYSPPPPPPPMRPVYKPVPPKSTCGHNVLIGCSPTVTRVPCGFSPGVYHEPHSHHESYSRSHAIVGSPNPTFEEPQYLPPPQNHIEPPAPYQQLPTSDHQLPSHDYQAPSHVHQPSPHVHQPPSHVHQPTPYVHSKPTYLHQPLSYVQEPVPSVPQASSHGTVSPQRPLFYASPNLAQHQQITSTLYQSKPHQPSTIYQPTYKSKDQVSPFSIPSFTPPVKEDVQETPQQPSISAFPTTTTASPSLPTVAADQDQHFRFAESPTSAPPSETDELAKEASGEEPENNPPASESTTSTTASPTPAVSALPEELE